MSPGRGGHCHSGDVHGGSVHDGGEDVGGGGGRVLDQGLHVRDHGVALGPQRLAVPVHQVLNLGKVLPLEGLGDQTGRLVRDGLGLGEGLAELEDVVTVHHDGVEAERLEPPPVGVHVVLQGRGVGLAEPVHVDDGAEVVELVVAREVERLPDVALHALPVPHETVSAVTRLKSSVSITLKSSVHAKQLLF